MNDVTRSLWKPRVSNGAVKGMRSLVQELTNNGELIVEFAIRVLLGQDLRLATDWVPLLKAGKIRRRTRAGQRRTAREARERLQKLRTALGVAAERPVVTMDDRRWAAQLLLSYGWGLPPRMGEISGDSPGRLPAVSALAIRAVEILEEFNPQGSEEETRLTRILAALAEDPVTPGPGLREAVLP